MLVSILSAECNAETCHSVALKDKDVYTYGGTFKYQNCGLKPKKKQTYLMECANGNMVIQAGRAV